MRPTEPTTEPHRTDYGFVRREYVRPFLPSGVERALDVGCGNGGFCSVLKEAGAGQVWGIDPDRRAAANAAAWADRIVVGRFPDDVPADAPPFDLVAFTDVLEHFEDPWSALRATATFLAPGGAVVASIPNIRFWPVLWALLVRRDFRYEDQGVLDRTHLRFFTRRTMIELFEASGFRVERGEPREYVGGKRARAVALMLGRDVRVKQYVLLARPV
ncbi:MAG: class I SAM-dependent methyltransferase [Acidimicrobiales bacterium]